MTFSSDHHYHSVDGLRGAESAGYYFAASNCVQATCAGNDGLPLTWYEAAERFSWSGDAIPSFLANPTLAFAVAACDGDATQERRSSTGGQE